MEKENLKLVIVGHVDHGKSTLIGRLLFDTKSLPEGKLEEVKQICEALGREIEFAFVMDHLQEEREQGVTIDTAQTFFKTEKRNYVIIDAPGHVEFIKNMITGASQAEAATLIVDADEGVREQTRRHAFVLSLLGLKQVVVVVNKMDLVEFREERFKDVKKELIEFLASLGIAPSYVIPISAKDGDNVAKKSAKMDWYDNLTVLEALDTFKVMKKPVEKPLRFPIQDVYKVNDKRILVGRVESGKLATGQKVKFLPAATSSIVKSIEVFEGQKASTEAGESIGMTLEDPLFIDRGEVVCDAEDASEASSKFKANLFWMSKQDFDGSETLQFRCATQEVDCDIEIEKRLNSSTLEVLEENASRLETNEVGQVTIKVNKPVCIDAFNSIREMGRFVIVRDNDVVAGGIVTSI